MGSKWAAFFQFHKFRNRLLFWLIIVGLLVLAIEVSVTVKSRRAILRQQAQSRVTSVCRLKFKFISKWLDERFGDIDVIGNRLRQPEMVAICRLPESDSRLPVIRKKARDFLQEVQRSYGDYHDVVLISAVTGRILAASRKEQEGKDMTENPAFRRAIRTRKVSLYDVHECRLTGQKAMTFGAPLFATADSTRLVGVILCTINLKNSLYPFLGDRTELGTTGETYLVNRNGLVISPLRDRKEATLHCASRLWLARPQASGSASRIDYLGRKSVAAYAFLPRPEWWLISKQSESEVFAPMKRVYRQYLIEFLLVSALIILVALVLSHTIQRPISEMVKIARRLRRGESLSEREIKPCLQRRDEFGFLAREFMQAAEELARLNRVSEGAKAIAAITVEAVDLTTFFTHLLQELGRQTRAEMAAFYHLSPENGRYRLKSALGLDKNQIPQEIDGKTSPGIFDRALRERALIRVVTPENTTFLFQTPVAPIVPREMVVLPLCAGADSDDSVTGLVFLAALQPFSEEAVDILQASRPSLELGLRKILGHERTRVLSQELERRNTTLQSVNQQIESQAEELQEQNEELQEQAEELRQQAEELQAQRDQLEVDSQRKIEFLAIVSHELRTPLNSVLALTHLLQQQKNAVDPRKSAEHLAVIEHNARRLLVLINDALDLTRLELGRMQLSIKSFLLDPLIERVLQSIRPLANEKKLELRVAVQDALVLQSDEQRVEQILLNLLSNAVKFTDDGYVEIRAFLTDDGVTIAVTDTGIGIDEAEQEEIFESFHQLDSGVTRRHAGLGLSISRRLARLLGGDIGVQSRKGGGSIFLLSLPVALSAQLSGARQSEKTDEKLSGSADGEAPRILVVENDEVAREIIRHAAEDAGCNVDEAANAVAGLAAIEAALPNLVILDLMMPDMDGFDFLRKLREAATGRDLPVLVFSAMEISPDQRRELADLGITEHLIKGSVSRHELISRMRKMLAGSTFNLNEQKELGS